MKYSKFVLGGFLATTIFAISCENNTATSPNQAKDISSSPSGGNVSGNISSSSGSGLGLIATPRPGSSNADIVPNEPSPFKTSAPFIIGKSAAPFGGSITTGSGSGSASASSEPGELIVPSKVSGKVWGYNISSKSYSPIANAEVSVGGSSMLTDAAGNYSTSDVISTATDISAAADGYLTSTVSEVSPGEARDIHLQPLDSHPRFNPNTISMEITSLNGKNLTNIAVSSETNPTASPSASGAPVRNFPSIFSFADNDNSRFIPSLLNSTTGRYRLEVNPVGNKTSAQGKLLIYDVERDNLGNATNPTQIKNFIFKDDIVFRVGDTSFPGGDITDTTSASNFANINVNFHDSNGFSDFVSNAYIVFPTGEKLLVSRFTGSSSSQITFRLPKLTGINNISYTVEAHAGNEAKGSDVVVNDLHENDSVEAYLLPTPTGLTPEYNTTSTGSTPSFSWSSVGDTRGYQVEVKSTEGIFPQSWEGFSKTTSISYPPLSPLKLGIQYRYQVIAMDFSFSRLSILNNKAEELSARAIKNSNDLPFKVQLANYNTGSLPKGYRVSYDTVLFRAR